ncbi:MAG: site-2 protease family protein [Burkholderiaceae bacterium]|nr:site-2 protease family protein [Burkholderiaceae bacterium]
MDLSLPQLIAVYAIPVILAITLHEAAHALVASLLGDSTAAKLGRVSANPLRHIDPVGTLLVPALILLSSKLLGGAGIIFGWAKPVPIVVSNLRSPRRDMGLVAAAGPLSNLAMALAWGLILKALTAADPGAGYQEFLARMAVAGVVVNLVLGLLNLMPIPPLDGGRVLVSLLPRRLAMPIARLEPYGIVILLLLLATGALGTVVGPLLDFGITVISSLLGLNN